MAREAEKVGVEHKEIAWVVVVGTESYDCTLNTEDKPELEAGTLADYQIENAVQGLLEGTDTEAEVGIQGSIHVHKVGRYLSKAVDRRS